MSNMFRPQTAEQVTEAIAWAVSEETPLEIRGTGSKSAIGRSVNTTSCLDLSGLSGVTLYEPEELVLTARAGTPIAEIETLLSASRQELAFEPADLGPLLGRPAGQGTIGGVLAANLSGPRRMKAGAARDHFLGVAAVSGRGEAFKSGGRVVKNVTGYDMCKLMAGSWGTLAAMTDVTVKVLPAAESVATVILTGLGDSRACVAMSAAVGSAYDVSGAAHVPRPLAASSGCAAVAAGGQAVTALRLEGFEASVSYRAEKLRGLLSSFGTSELLDEDASRVFWRDVRDVRFFADGTDRPVWKLSVPPMSGAGVAERLAAAAPSDVFLDWAGGLVWARTEAGPDQVRTALGGEGHATLVRADNAMRATVDVFQPQDAGLAALSRRIKKNFDPAGILNPGRIYQDA